MIWLITDDDLLGAAGPATAKRIERFYIWELAATDICIFSRVECMFSFQRAIKSFLVSFFWPVWARLALACRLLLIFLLVVVIKGEWFELHSKHGVVLRLLSFRGERLTFAASATVPLLVETVAEHARLIERVDVGHELVDQLHVALASRLLAIRGFKQSQIK